MAKQILFLAFITILVGAGCENYTDQNTSVVNSEIDYSTTTIATTTAIVLEENITDDVEVTKEPAQIILEEAIEVEVDTDIDTSVILDKADVLVEEPAAIEKSIVPTADSIAVVWPQSFNSLELGSTVNLSWRVHEPTVGTEPLEIDLFKSDGSFVGNVGTVQKADSLHFPWKVALPGSFVAGDYKVRVSFVNGAFSESEIFSIFDPTPIWLSSDAEVTWPQPFNSLQIGSTVNIAWKVNKPALNDEPMHINLLHEDGTFAQTVGFVSMANVKHYEWNVTLTGDNTPGKYKIQLSTDSGFSTVGKAFSIAGIN